MQVKLHAVTAHFVHVLFVVVNERNGINAIILSFESNQQKNLKTFYRVFMITASMGHTLKHCRTRMVQCNTCLSERSPHQINEDIICFDDCLQKDLLKKVKRCKLPPLEAKKLASKMLLYGIVTRVISMKSPSILW